MLVNNRPYNWYYKKYICGNLKFSADTKHPFILNLNIREPWIIAPDTIINPKTEERIQMRIGNFKKYDKQAIVDIPWEMTLKDAKEKYEYVIKEYRKLNNSYDPNQPELFKFHEEVWFNYSHNKINLKRRSKGKIDEIHEQILSLRQEDFVSHIFEKKYQRKKKKIFLK